MPDSLKHITPRKAAELLKQDGIIVSEEEAGKIAEFLYFVGDEIINQYIASFAKNNNPITTQT